MAKVTITIEGTPEEVNESIQRLAGRNLQQSTTGVSWLPEEIEQLFTSIQDGAQNSLRQIATNPSRENVMSSLRVSAHALSGTMSSVEFQRKRLFPCKPRPVDYNYETEEYDMLPEFAEWIRDHSTS